jgi:hypothetical protein
MHLLYKGLVGRVRLWDPATGAVLQTLGGHRDLIYAIAFSSRRQATSVCIVRYDSKAMGPGNGNGPADT